MRRLKQWTAALCAMVLLMSAVPAAGAYSPPAPDRDAYGRSCTRVIGGTYYGEQTQDNVWTARIHGYICPMNNGQKHVIQWMGDNWQTTCTQGGNTYNYCTLCGEKEILKEEEPLGHDFVNGVCTRGQVVTFL